MKKNIILCVAVSVVVMLAFPWFAVSFVKGDAGMAVCFLLFFAVNPLYSVLIGAFAGKDIWRLWSLPVIPASNEPSGCLQTFGDCREGQIPRCSAALQV